MHSTDWASLNHAYGRADDIPALLASARRAAAPNNYKDEPWFSLWSALCHQGDVYTASYAAVPELVAIAKARAAETAVAGECLLMAAMIELERMLPEGPQPPSIPYSLKSSYAEALRRGAQLSAGLLAAASEPELRDRLAISSAALGGDANGARLLVDSHDV
jgi:hypothetical protein